MNSSKRLLSVDCMRGYTVAAMLMVNFPGNENFVYSTLQHSKWNGLTFTDIVAPFFLFIVGTSIVLAFSPKLEQGVPKSSFHKKIILRSLKIFAVGMFLNMLPDFNFGDLRWTGTLHRIAIVYLVCAFLFLYTNRKQQIIIGSFILVAYWLVMTLIPTPGYGKVMLEPGVNLAAWIDSKYLPGKMWQGTWDPEGILSTFPSFVSCITGMMAGYLLRNSKLIEWERPIWLMITGIIMATLGYFWGLLFPVNENIWTSSFVLVTSGFAFLVLGASHYLTDLKEYTRYAKTGVVFGMNAITVYVLGDLLSLVFYQAKLGGDTINGWGTKFLTQIGFEPKLASLMYAVTFVAICYLPCLWLYRKKIFIKL